MTRALLVLNVAMFLAEAYVGKGIGSVPGRTSLLFGANAPLETLRDLHLETLVTCCFLHGGIIHVAFNMMVLWQAGPLVERSVGSERMAPMYLVSGIAASLASALRGYLLDNDIPSVGASGALMGVIGAALVLAWRAQGWSSPLTRSLARWLGINLAFGFLINAGGRMAGGVMVDNAAHVGGAIAGALIALMWRRGVTHSKGARAAILAACAFVVLAAFAVVVWRDTQDPFAAFRP